jgi:predicted RNA binding protein YcfA (HicA-like mRNA interferase family)
MSRLPTLTGRQVLRALGRGGFSVIRIKGSHHFMRHDVEPSRQTVEPVHGNEDIGRPLLRKIIADVGLTVDEFIALL